MSSPEPVSLFRVSATRRTPDIPPTRIQRLVAVVIWLVAAAIALMVNPRINLQTELPGLGFSFLLYGLAVLFGIRLPGGVYVGFAGASLIGIALVIGAERAMLVALVLAIPGVLFSNAIARVLRLPGPQRHIMFYESIYWSAANALCVFPVIWLYRRLGGGIPPDLSVWPLDLEVLAVAMVVYAVLDIASTHIWLSAGGIPPRQRMRRYWQLIVPVNYLTIVFAPLMTIAFAQERIPLHGLIPFVVALALLYGLTSGYLDLARRADDLAVLNSIGQALSASLDYDTLVAALRREIGKLLDVSSFYLAVHDEKSDNISFLVDYEEGQPVKFDPHDLGSKTPTGHIIRTCQPLLINHDVAGTAAKLGLEPLGRPPCSYVAVPVMTGERAIGVIGLRNYQREYAFTQQDVRLLETIASQAGVALQNAHLYQRSQHQASELTSLNQLSSMLSSTLEPDRLIHTVCQMVVEVMGYHKAAVFLLDENGTQFRMVDSVGLSKEFGSRSGVIDLDSIRSETVRTKRPLAISDILDTPHFADAQWMAETDRIRTVLDVPLRIGERVIGALTAYNTQPRRIQTTEVELLETLGGQVAVALENARLFDAMRARSHELETLYRISGEITASLSLKHVLRALSSSLLEALGAPGCATWLATEDRSALRAELRISAARGSPRERKFEPISLALRDMPHVMRAGRQRKARLLRGDDPGLRDAEKRLLAHSQAVCGVVLPLVVRSRLIGLVLVSPADEVCDFKLEQIRLAESLANQAAIAIENARLFERTDVALARRLEEIAALERISQRMTSHLDLQAVIEQVAVAAVEATGAEHVDVAVLDETADMLRTVISHTPVGDSPAEEWPAAEGITGRALRTKQVLNVGDVRDDPDYVPAREDVLSELAVPIVLEGHFVGVLNLESARLNAFTDDHARFVSSLAKHAAIAIANARLFEAAQRRAEEFGTLRTIAIELLASPDLQNSLRTLTRHALAQTGAEDIHIYLYDQAADRLTFGASQWRNAEASHEIQVRPRGMTATVARTGGRIVVMDLPNHPLFADVAHLPPWASLGAIMGVPLKMGSEVVGVFTAAFTDKSLMTEETLRFFDLLAAQAAAAIGTARLAEETRLGRDRLQAILDSSHDGIMMFDTQGHLVIANPRTEYLLNLRARDYVGWHILDIVRHLKAMFHREDPSYSRKDVIKLLRQIGQDPNAITRRTYSVNGNPPHAVEEISTGVASQDGTLLGRLFILRDITQELELEGFRQEMSHMLVHDLRSPLTGVITGLHLALEELALPPEDVNSEVLRATLDVAYSSSNSLLGLVEAILDVNKLEAGEVPLMLGPINLRTIAQQAVARLQGLATEAEIGIQITAPDDLPDLVADADKIERVFINLLDNALKYTPRSGCVDIVIEAAATHQTVSVIDSGEGIPPEFRERVFERFVQVTGAARKRGPKGTGLGLTFCRLAVEAHRGRIWVDDGPEGGAAFRYTLPTGIMPNL